MDPVVAVPRKARANFRRVLVLASGVGLAALVGSAPFGYLGFAAFGCLGLALGALNTWMVHRSVLTFAAAGVHDRRRFTASVLARLGGVTLLALILALLVRPSGVGVFLGLAAFQILSIGNASVPALKELRQS